MTQPVKSDPVTLLALGSRMGLQGFASAEKLSVEAGGDQKPSAGVAAIAAAKQTGLKGFTVSAPAPAQSQPPRRKESTMALAVRLGLPGFVQKEVVARAADPVSKPLTVSPTIRVSSTPAPVAPQKSATRSAAPAPQMSKLQFVCVDIATGGVAAFTALEIAMGQPFAPKIGGVSTWLQRNNPDGSQTRGYPAMTRELGKLGTMSGHLGSPSLRLSVSRLPVSEFAPHTATGRVPTNTRPSAAFVDSDLPDALQRALAK